MFRKRKQEDLPPPPTGQALIEALANDDPAIGRYLGDWVTATAVAELSKAVVDLQSRLDVYEEPN